MQKENNITIGQVFDEYNTKLVFNKVVKIPCYVIQDVIEGNKKIIIKHNGKQLAVYTTKELKKNLMSVEGKVYNGWFKKKQIKYNLTLIKV